MKDRFFAPVDAAGPAFFRVAFGLIVAWELYGSATSGSVQEIYVDPAFRFTYYGFEWVDTPTFGVPALFLATAGAALALALGLWQRVSALVFTLGFGWIFFLEKARYLNHFYLVLLLGALLVCVPASGALALSRRAAATPAWGLMLLRAQVGIVYLYAGIAKLNADWLRAAPLRDWLPARADRSLFGPLLETEACAWIFSYGAIFLDLFAWPALAHRRTRLPAFALTSAFHLTNSTLFGIGIFPWTMIAATTLFFEPDWPRRFWPRAGGRVGERSTPSGALSRKLVLGGVGLYLAFQVLFPLRHFLYPGRPSWNEEGHRFAWHMKLRDKEGEVRFHVHDTETGETWIVDPRTELSSRQYRKMRGTPDMMLEYAHHLAKTYPIGDPSKIQVFAAAQAGLNGRPFQTFVDPDVDLSRERRGFARYEWVEPLTERLR